MIEIFFNSASSTLILLIWACFALPVLLCIFVTILRDKIEGYDVLGKKLIAARLPFLPGAT